jgi:hypothetical protein
MTTLARKLKARVEALVLDQLDTGRGLVPMHLDLGRIESDFPWDRLTGVARSRQ